MISFLEELMGPVFRQLQLESEEKSGSLLVSKKGKADDPRKKKDGTVKGRRKSRGRSIRRGAPAGLAAGALPQSKEELYSGRRDSGSVFGGAGRADGGRAGGTREI